MARIADLKLAHRLFMKAFRYRSVDWRPGARLDKTLRDSKLALITTAGLHLPPQPPFDPSVRGGDFSFREIPGDVNIRELKISHCSTAFERTGARQDRNLVFPLDRCRELVERGELGALNHRHFSFMGSISAPGRLIAKTAPQVALKLREDGVDAVFLVPV
jgi:D-proline reductase (dithiol) PrdB